MPIRVRGNILVFAGCCISNTNTWISVSLKSNVTMVLLLLGWGYIKGKLYISQFWALNVPTGPHYGHTTSHRCPRNYKYTWHNAFFIRGKRIINVERTKKKKKKLKNWAYCLYHATAKPVQILYVLMSAVSIYSGLCVYHASLLTRSYSDGWGSGKHWKIILVNRCFKPYLLNYGYFGE